MNGTEKQDTGTSTVIVNTFLNQGLIDSLPTKRLRDFVTDVSANITVFSTDQLKAFSLKEKAALVSHPIFRDILTIFAFDTMIGLTKPSPKQMAALRFLSQDLAERREDIRRSLIEDKFQAKTSSVPTKDAIILGDEDGEVDG